MHVKLLPVLLLIPASAGAGPRPRPPDVVGPTVVTTRSLFLRNAFDTDPSLYLGRFIPDGTPATEIDESRGMQTQCTKYIQYKEVGGGGVLYDELYTVSTGAGLSAQLPQIATVSLGAGAGRNVRVKYVIDKKMISYIAEPDKYASCCARAPDQCPAEYIGEFVSGTGAIYYGKGAEAAVSAEIDPPGLDVITFPKVELKHGQSWTRGIVFTQPVYFGFKLYPNPATAPEWGCADAAVPQSSLGYYFIGVSSQVNDEARARDDAMLNARRQVVQLVGEQIQSGELTVQRSDGVTGVSPVNLTSESWVEGKAAGIASLVQPRKTCVEKVAMPTGYLYQARTLAWVPNASVESAAVIVAAAPTSSPSPGVESRAP